MKQQQKTDKHNSNDDDNRTTTSATTTNNYRGKWRVEVPTQIMGHIWTYSRETRHVNGVPKQSKTKYNTTFDLQEEQGRKPIDYDPYPLPPCALVYHGKNMRALDTRQSLVECRSSSSSNSRSSSSMSSSSSSSSSIGVTA